jgi:asparagine synthase (glutamine-hydrolysing)
MLAHTGHDSVVCPLQADDVPDAAASLQAAEDEPFGGIPTIAYAKVFETARRLGAIVLLDGQGIDEQWAGYDYYAGHDTTTLIQGGRDQAVQPACVMPEFAARSKALRFPTPYPDRLRNLQYRDLCFTKLQRALRFNDRISMRHSTELREPFLDHRLVELALRQPADRKIHQGEHKWLVRQIAARLMPQGLTEAPKRPVQTPQREWLRGPLRRWANDLIEEALALSGGEWLNRHAVRAAWRDYCAGRSDHSFYVWQWISLALILGADTPKPDQPGTPAGYVDAVQQVPL